MTSKQKNYETINYCEIDKYASKSYSRIHNVPESLNLGDITLVDTENLADYTMLVGGSPCFVAGTKVLTARGYQNIEDVRVGDMVLTHKNQWKPVLRTGFNEDNNVYEVLAKGMLPIHTTPNHPFMVSTRKKKSEMVDGKRVYHYEYSEPQEKRVDELNCKNDFLCSPIIKETHNRYKLDVATAWLVGRFFTNGVLSGGRSHGSYNVVFTINKKEVAEFERYLTGYHYSCYTSTATLVTYVIHSKKLFKFLESQAAGHKIPVAILHLPETELKAFLDGFFSGKGNSIKKETEYQAKVVDRVIADMLALAVQKAYHVGCKLTKKEDIYVLKFSTVESKGYIVENDMILYPLQEVGSLDKKDRVYNLEVADDNTYTVHGVYVHNCQDFSAAGKKQGALWTCKTCNHKYNPLEAHYTTRDKCPKCGSDEIEKTRSSLIVEYLRILRSKMPKFAVYENVKNLVGKEFKPTFELFVKELEEYGYNVYYEVLNAKFYGIPQNRERVILVAIRKDLDNGKFEFPEPFDSGLRLKDMLATQIDSKYYIDKAKTEALLSTLDDNVKGKLYQSMNNINNIGLLDFKGRRQCRSVSGENGICPTLTTMQGGQQEPKVLVSKCPLSNYDEKTLELIRVGMLEGNFDQLRRVYNIEGICPTLTSGSRSKGTGDTNPPKILVKNDLNKIDVKDVVRVRKHSVNIEALQKLLGDKKKASGLSNAAIAAALDIPKTKVDHWFRKDSSFAIPDAELWMRVKELLHIKTDSFDKSIMTFIEKENEYEKSNRIYITDGIAPTLTTVSADEKIIYPCAFICCEPRTDGMTLYNGNNCGTLRTIDACGDKHIIEAVDMPEPPLDIPLCCASRGRNPENPSDRTVGAPTVQHLECNSGGTTNTLTSVQKDNYILEPCALKYQRNEYGKAVRKAYESGEISEKMCNMRDLTLRQDGMCNTLTTVQKDNYLFDPSWFAIRKLIPLEAFRLMGFDDSDFEKAKYCTEEEIADLKARNRKYKTEIDEHGVERVVFLSDSQAYKQAGNSIVTNVLYEVYKELYRAIPELFDDLKLVSLFSGIGAFEKALDNFYEWRQDGANF